MKDNDKCHDTHNHEHGCCGSHNHNHEHGCGGSHSHNHEHGCCGSHNHNHEHGCCDELEEEFMTLLLDNDTEVKCSVIDIFEVEDKEYIALLPVGEDEVLLYQYIEKTDEEFELKNIETDEEFEKVEKAFFELFDEDIFEDDEEYEYDDYDDEE